jgi:mediator of RNA polymerase II transcription subunit 14
MKFSTLVSRAVEDSFLSLKDLVDKSKATQQYDSDKKISLLKHLVYTQLRMLRINVLGKWCQQVKKIFFYWLGFCVKELIWFTLNSVCLEFLFIDPGQPIWPVTRSLYRSTSGSGLKTMCGLLHEFKLIIFIKIIIFF